MSKITNHVYQLRSFSFLIFFFINHLYKRGQDARCRKIYPSKFLPQQVRLPSNKHLNGD